MEALSNVDWDLLHQQKLTLVEMLGLRPDESPQSQALAGIIHLLDALQDEAAEQGRWRFPGEGENRDDLDHLGG